MVMTRVYRHWPSTILNRAASSPAPGGATLFRPSPVLQNDPIPIGVLERPAAPVPVRVEGRYRLVPPLFHPRPRPAPLVGVRQIKHEQVVRRRRSPRRAPRLLRELQVICRPTLPQHHTI